MTHVEARLPIERGFREKDMPILDILVIARNDRNRAVPDDLLQIDMRIMNPHIREIRERTQADPRHREHAKAVFLNTEKGYF